METGEPLTYSAETLVRGAWCCLRLGWTDDAAHMIEAIPSADWQRPDVLEVAGAVLMLPPAGARWED